MRSESENRKKGFIVVSKVLLNCIAKPQISIQ